MRFYSIYFLCKELYSPIDGLSFVDRKTKPASYYISSWKEYQEYLTTLSKITIFENDVDSFYNEIHPSMLKKEKPEVDITTKNKLESLKRTIVNKMGTVIALYNSMDLPETQKGIDVKIPPCDSLKEYINILEDVNFVFEQCPVLQTADASIKFCDVDVGSAWLGFAILGSAAAITFILNNLAMLVDKALQIKSHFLNLKEQETILEERQNEREFQQDIKESYEFLEKYYISEAEKEIEQKNEGVIKDEEERSKLEFSLNKLEKLLDKGVEIYPTIDTSKEVQVLFPPLSNSQYVLPEEHIKYIEDKTEDKKE